MDSRTVLIGILAFGAGMCIELGLYGPGCTAALVTIALIHAG